jgi:hypothetical protein
MTELYLACRFLDHGRVVKYLFNNPQTNLFEDDYCYFDSALCDHGGNISEFERSERVLLLDILLNHYVKQNKKKSEEDPYYYLNDDDLRNVFDDHDYLHYLENSDVLTYKLHPMYVPLIEQYLPGFITSVNEYYTNGYVSNCISDYVLK